MPLLPAEVNMCQQRRLQYKMIPGKSCGHEYICDFAGKVMMDKNGTII